MTVARRVTQAGPWAMHDVHAGTGPPVVCVHGLAVSGRYFVPLVDALAGRYSASAVDLPGFGRSPGPAAALDVEGLAEALATWLRARGLEQATLVGNSAGCQYIVACVRRFPDITGRLVLIGPTVDPRARSAGGQIGRLLRCGVTADIVQVPALLADIGRAGLGRVRQTFHAVLDDAIENALPHVENPTLVVRGEDDHLVPRQWAEQVRWLLRRADLAEIAGAGHVPHRTHAQPVARLIHRWLTTRGARP